MAYQVLARKWRPHDFSTLIGQDHVVKALTHALTHDRLHHAYLFTGTRGVGKTTISRILAKCLNCTGPDGKGGITATPCGECDACRSIDEDRFVDYVEMDAASTRGIDDMVTLLERAKYPPTNARFKVYMIDEVHQLTSQAFNAMLKTLEEPPPYVKFILATTDPQKVPVTVLSRCLQFSLKNLSPTAVADHMKELLDKEKIWYEPEAVRMLSEGAKGSMRDGLSLLDQAIAYSAEHLSVDSVREMLGTVDTTTLFRLLSALASRDAAGVIAVADEIGSRGLSYEQALKDMAVILQRVSMAQFFPQSLTEAQPDSEAIKQLTQAFTPDELQLYYQIAIHSRNEMNLAPDEYSGFTMALLRMLAFSPYDGTLPKKEVVQAVETPKVISAQPAPKEQKKAIEARPSEVAKKVESPASVSEPSKAKEEKQESAAKAAKTTKTEENKKSEVEPAPKVETKAEATKVEATKEKPSEPEEKASVEAQAKEEIAKPAKATTKRASKTAKKATKAAEDPNPKAKVDSPASGEDPADPSTMSAVADSVADSVKKNNSHLETSPLADSPAGTSSGLKKDPPAVTVEKKPDPPKTAQANRVAEVYRDEPPDDYDGFPEDEYINEFQASEMREWEKDEQREAAQREPANPRATSPYTDDEFKGVVVKMNPWLEVAQNIKLEDASQPLVEESEFVSFNNNELVIAHPISELRRANHTGALLEELRKTLNPDLTLKVMPLTEQKGQTLKRWRRQEFEREKKEKFDKISSTKRVKEIAKFFGASLKVENMTLFDEKNKPRKVK